MAEREPITTLAQEFSSEGASPIAWSEGRQQLEAAEIYWLATVRPDGRPHVAPLISIWHDGALYFCTGPNERKARNTAENPHCIVLTGSNQFEKGLDLVVEGDAVTVTDDARLHRIAEAYVAKYGNDWLFTVHDGAFYHGVGSLREEYTGKALVYEVVPETAFGFGRGQAFSQTRWRF